MYGFDRSFDEPTQKLPPVGHRRSWATGSTVAVVASFLAVVTLVAVGFVLLAPDRHATAGPQLSSSPTGSASPSVDPSPTPSPTPTPTPSRTAAPRVTHTVVPIPSQKPPPAELPPPPPPPVATTGPSCPQWNQAGDAAPSVVRSALAAAGAQQNWRSGVTEPNGWTGGPYPSITVPASLMNAVAFTESSWRSTVISCDGGIGLMQVMPNTATWMNGRFNRSYDVHTVDGNTNLGAMYLQWLTMYFGLYYFGSFDLNDVQPIRTGGGDIRLGDVVIAAYNVGYGAIEHRADNTLSIPNQWYVDRVKGYVASCPCDSM